MIWQRFFLVMILISMLGCTAAPKVAYQGERLAPDKEAVLSADGIHSVVGFHHKIFISKINDESMKDKKAALAGQMFPYPHLVYLRPGRYTVRFIYMLGLSYAVADVWFDAKEGVTYHATGEPSEHFVKMWIKDSQGKLVSGIGKAPVAGKEGLLTD